jgi:hypothetical protein
VCVGVVSAFRRMAGRTGKSLVLRLPTGRIAGSKLARMGQTYAAIDDQLRQFVEAQHVFFVATAPSGRDGHVNVSPKGLNTLRILGPRTVAYLDYIGSGVETIAHLRDNGRITIMVCAFDGPPKIVRLHGRGDVIEPQDPRFGPLVAHFEPAATVRAIIVVELTRIGDSCGYGVPLYQFAGDRTQLPAWAEKKGESELRTYQRDKNAHSIDGLEGLRWVNK